MIGRTAAFDAAVRDGGSVAYSVIAQRQNFTSGVVDRTAEGLRVIGSPMIKVDSSAASRRSVTLTIADEDGTLAPKRATDILSPYGNELVLETGFNIGGFDDLLPVGVFRIVKSKATGEGAVEVECLDRSIVVQRNRFQVPFEVPSMDVVDAIEYLLADRYPGLTVTTEHIIGAWQTIPATVYQEGDHSGDPWKNAADLAASAGLEVYMNPRGEAVIRPVPDLTGESSTAWTYQPGADSLIIDSRLGLDVEGAYNIAVVSGEGTNVTTPARGSAQVVGGPMDPASFGPVPIFLVSPLVTTDAQAVAAAQAMVLRKAGGSERMAFTAAPHPAHEAGDIVRVVNDDLVYDERVVLTSFAMPLLLDQQVEYETGALRTAS